MSLVSLPPSPLSPCRAIEPQLTPALGQCDIRVQALWHPSFSLANSMPTVKGIRKKTNQNKKPKKQNNKTSAGACLSTASWNHRASDIHSPFLSGEGQATG